MKEFAMVIMLACFAVGLGASAEGVCLGWRTSQPMVVGVFIGVGLYCAARCVVLAVEKTEEKGEEEER